MRWTQLRRRDYLGNGGREKTKFPIFEAELEITILPSGTTQVGSICFSELNSISFIQSEFLIPVNLARLAAENDLDIQTRFRIFSKRFRF